MNVDVISISSTMFMLRRNPEALPDVLQTSELLIFNKLLRTYQYQNAFEEVLRSTVDQRGSVTYMGLGDPLNVVRKQE
jgi:hypothetical protein